MCLGMHIHIILVGKTAVHALPLLGMWCVAVALDGCYTKGSIFFFYFDPNCTDLCGLKSSHILFIQLHHKFASRSFAICTIDNCVLRVLDQIRKATLQNLYGEKMEVKPKLALPKSLKKVMQTKG